MPEHFISNWCQFLNMKTRLLLLAASACAVDLAQSASAAQGQQPVHRSFELVALGRAAPTKGATAASYHSYRSEYGTAVVQLREWYKSAGDARTGRAATRPPLLR